MVKFFAFGMDKGFDNVGMIKMAKMRLAQHACMMIVCVWCFFHQYHLCIQASLCVLDTWDWIAAAKMISADSQPLADSTEAAEDSVERTVIHMATPPQEHEQAAFETNAIPFRYFSALATICNVWRSVNIPTKVHNALASIRSIGPTIADTVCRKLLGRLVRGRWGSCDDV